MNSRIIQIFALTYCLGAYVQTAELKESSKDDSAHTHNAAAQEAIQQAAAIKSAAVAVLRNTDPIDSLYIESTHPVALALEILQQFRTDDIGDLLVKHVRTFVNGIDAGRKAQLMLIANSETSIPAITNGIRLGTESDIPVLCDALVKITKSVEKAQEVLRLQAEESKERSVAKKFEQTAVKFQQYVEVAHKETQFTPIEVPDNAWEVKVK